LSVFDKPMCCSSGVCGPEPDEELMRFSADLEWLRKQGITVRRFNPAQEPGAFTGDPVVRRALQERGAGCLPLVVWGKDVITAGAFPDRNELVRVLGLSPLVNAGGAR